jgi:hypothetical protein
VHQDLASDTPLVEKAVDSGKAERRLDVVLLLNTYRNLRFGVTGEEREFEVRIFHITRGQEKHSESQLDERAIQIIGDAHRWMPWVK